MEPQLSLHTSNRLDILVDHLAETLKTAPLPPLEREIVIVQSQGMQRWLTLRLARLLGISASLTTPFPRPFCRWLAQGVLANDATLPAGGEIPRIDVSSFGREALLWRLFAALGELPGSPTAMPGAYLLQDADQRKRFGLAKRLAALFDDYQVYRPDLLRAWRQGESIMPSSSAESWQAELWRGLLTDTTAESLAAGSLNEEPLNEVLGRLLQRLHGSSQPAGLPRRISVLGVSTLPPLILQVLAAAARFVPVTLYFTSPTYHYWGDLRSERETRRWQRRLRAQGLRLEEAHFERGNALLAALGRQGRDFFNLLQEADASGEAWHQLDFANPPADSALGWIQSDILHLVDRQPEERIQLAAQDASLEIHSCHSPMREMEVLRDRLLRAFEDIPGLRPDDVLVLVPDIELYGPYIQSVFEANVSATEGATEADPASIPRLPFSIADRRSGREAPPADSILQIFDLVGARLSVRQVFDLLEIPAVRRRWRLLESELPQLRQWTELTRVRWGMDGEQRRDDFAVPLFEANSWRAGIDRLLLGYATGDVDELVAGIAPQAGDLAGAADTLGRFASFLDALFHQLRQLRHPRPLAQWGQDLASVIDDLLQADGEDEERGLQKVRDLSHELTATAEQLQIDEDVHRQAIAQFLHGRLDEEGFGSGFINGRITFCALKPMRTIPFRIICVAGLDDGAFPRRELRRGFDLMAAAPQPGDRSQRDDDRYLFLETLLAADDRLILTYVGRSQREASEREPSVVVSELLDHLDRTFGSKDDTDAVAVSSRIEHRLQAWSADYFRGSNPKLYSYSHNSLLAAQTLVGRQSELPRFLDTAASEGDEAADEIPTWDLDELIDFWLHPPRYYCRRMLELGGGAGELEAEPEADSEPFTVEGLDAYQIRQWLLEQRLLEQRLLEQRLLEQRTSNAGSSVAESDSDVEASEEHELAVLRARGELPDAGLGSSHFARSSRRVDAFRQRLPEHRKMPPLSATFETADWRLTGRIDGLTDLGLLRFRCANLRPADRLRGWIEHLFLVASGQDGNIQDGTSQGSTQALLIGEDLALRFPADLPAAELLATLVDGWRQGRRGALPVLPRASWAFTEQMLLLIDPRRRAVRTPLEVAREAYKGSADHPGDQADPWIRLCFRGLDPLADPDFQTWAEALWRPILENGVEERP